MAMTTSFKRRTKGFEARVDPRDLVKPEPVEVYASLVCFRVQRKFIHLLTQTRDLKIVAN